MEASEANDIAGTGEEAFEIGMRQNALERDDADADNDGLLDFDEFCDLVRDREKGNFSVGELMDRFEALDVDNSGKVDISEYLQFSLRDALARSSERVCDLFRKWDEDRSGTIDRTEWTRAVRALGFDVSEADAGKVFDTIDVDKSGQIEYTELNATLRKGGGSEFTKANLKRAELMNSKKLAGAFVARVTALPPMVKLTTESGVSVPEQLKAILNEPLRSVKVLDLFRDWDADGDGVIDRKELRQAVAALGYDASIADLDILFDELDADGDGTLQYAEFKKALRNCSKRQYHVAEVRPNEQEQGAAQQAPAKPATRPLRPLLKSIVGERVRIYWPEEGRWHTGTVSRYLVNEAAYCNGRRTQRVGTTWQVDYGALGPGGRYVCHDLEETQWELEGPPRNTVLG